MNRYLLSKAGINANEGINRFRGSVTDYEEFLRAFSSDTQFNNLNEAIKSRDIKEAFQAGHALKGLAGNLSMTELYNALTPLVEELRKNSFEGVEELFIAVKEDYDKIINVLNEQYK